MEGKRETRKSKKKKKKKPHQIINSQGQKLENKDGILKEFARYYKEFFKKRPAKNMEKEVIEQKLENKF